MYREKYLVDKTSLVVEPNPLVVPVRERYLLLAIPYQRGVLFVEETAHLQGHHHRSVIFFHIFFKINHSNEDQHFYHKHILSLPRSRTRIQARW